jgi:hypothetical protein
MYKEFLKESKEQYTLSKIKKSDRYKVPYNLVNITNKLLCVIQMMNQRLAEYQSFLANSVKGQNKASISKFSYVRPTEMRQASDNFLTCGQRNDYGQPKS